MGKNTKGGKNYKKQKKVSHENREIIFKDLDQNYGRILKKLGDGRFECQVFDNDLSTKYIGKICGSMRKRVWINAGDIVLVSLRSFDSSSCDIIHKYTNEEAFNLKSYKELPENLNLQASIIELAEGKLESDNNDIEFNFEKL